MSKVFARRATCGEMNICVVAFDYNTVCEPYSIHFMNQATWAGQNLIEGRIWPVGRTLDMPDLGSPGHCICFKILHEILSMSGNGELPIDKIEQFSTRFTNYFIATNFKDFKSPSTKNDMKKAVYL